MKHYTNNLMTEMHQGIQIVEKNTLCPLKRSEQSYGIIEASIKKLKEFITQYQFKDDREEIEFFKEIQPKFFRELFYFQELIHIEANRPHGTKKSYRNYYNQQLTRLEDVFNKNRHLYNYYLCGKSHHDEYYFLRKSRGLPWQYVCSLSIDTGFSTVYSLKLAKLQAYEQLGDHLQKALSNETVLPLEFKKMIADLEWTDKKVELAELVYSLFKKGAFNNGKATLKQICNTFEMMCNVRIGNLYRILQDMIIRKELSPYMDDLKLAFVTFIKDAVK
ncbi:RteC domain-containing protein [Pedobacter nutrimenti]|uniref:RteC domain-containing protein n=1 Tax=Pedobacter nutrimenti TaxID=1241337 RepID=UPI002931A0FB|nr:RteC domain-containing protein [Pedobacter nutrimenti]